MTGNIHVGVGGWSYEPWCGLFYPDDLPAKRQLEYASRQLTAIEINGTFYRTQTPATFAKWAAETPDGFMFTVKAHRMATSRKTPDEMKDSIGWFLNSGVTELGDKLGPINWQFSPYKRFEREYFESFLGLLPPEIQGRPLRHAIEIRHKSFEDPAFLDLLREHRHAVVFTDAEDWPSLADETADFAYVRLQRAEAERETGYSAGDLDRWAATFRDWAERRDVFAFFISGAKERNPAAAKALIERL